MSHDAPTTDRRMPQAMLDLYLLALETGTIDQVELGYEGLDAEFPAPVGWMLHLTRVEPELAHELGVDGDDNHLCVTAQVGSNEPQAFRGLDEPYWGPEQITAWITRPRAGLPQTQAAPVEIHDVDLMLHSALNGWSCRRMLLRNQQYLMQERMPNHDPFLMISYRFSALNWHYNDPSHPAHRDTGAQVSLDLSLGRFLDKSSWNHALIEAKNVDPEEVLSQLKQRCPWYADVAYFDETKDTWAL